VASVVARGTDTHGRGDDEDAATCGSSVEGRRGGV